MAILFQLQAMAPKEKYCQLNLLYVALRLAGTGKTPLGKAVSDHFAKKKIDPQGRIEVSSSELSALKQKIGEDNYQKHVLPGIC